MSCAVLVTTVADVLSPAVRLWMLPQACHSCHAGAFKETNDAAHADCCVQEFRQEVAIMKRMKHPNVVRMLSLYSSCQSAAEQDA